MIPELYGADGVAREIVRDHERRLAKRQLLSQLPPVPSRSLMMRRSAANAVGRLLVSLGERLSSYGRTEPVSEPWRIQPQSH